MLGGSENLPVYYYLPTYLIWHSPQSETVELQKFVGKRDWMSKSDPSGECNVESEQSQLLLLLFGKLLTAYLRYLGR